MDIKSLSIQVQAKGVQQAANALGNLAKNAAQLDPVLTKAKSGLDTLSKISLGTTNAQVSDVSDSITRLRNTTKDFSNIGQGFKGLSNAMTSTATAVDKLVGSATGLQAFNVQLEALRNTLTEMKGMSGVLTGIGQSAANASSRQAGGSSTKSASSDTDAYAKSQQRVIRQAEQQAVLMEKGRIGLIEYNAAQKGVSDQAAPFIARMRAATKTMVDGKEISKQYAAALRMVPAQFTDIATQLAGGQNPMLILLQQGGQLKDMFGGVGAAAKAAGSYIVSVLTNPYILAAAAVGGLAYAVYRSSEQLNDFNKSIDLTGNYIGLTTGQVGNLEANMTGLKGTSSDVIEAFTAMAASGKITGDQIGIITQATVNFSKATGTEIEKVVAEYASLSKNPADALLSLNEKYHFLTASVYENVRSLQLQGKETEATKVAQLELASAQESMAAKVVEHAGYAEKALKGVKAAVIGVIDAIGSWGREDSTSDLVKALERVAAAKRLLAAHPDDTQNKEEVVRAEALLRVEQERVNTRQREDALAKTRTEQNEANLKAIQAIEAIQSRSNSQKQKQLRMDNEIKAIQEKYSKADSSNSDVDKKMKELSLEEAIADIREKYREKGQSGTNKLADLEAERKALDIDIEGYTQKGAAYEKLTAKAKELFAIEYRLSGKQERVPEKEAASLRAQAAQLQVIVDKEKELAGVKDTASTNEDIQKAIDKTTAHTKALQSQYKELQNGSAGKAKLTQAEVDLQEVTDQLSKTTDGSTKALLNNQLAVLNADIAANKLVKTQAQVNAVNAETSKLREQGIAEVSNLIAKYEAESSLVGLSNDERKIQQELLTSEATKKTQLADVQAELNDELAKGKEKNDAYVQSLENKKAQIEANAAARAKAIQSQPSWNAPKESDSMLTNAEAGFKNFYSSVTKQQSLFQSAFSQSYSLMGDTLDTFFTTGKVNAKSFLVDMLKMISKLIAQLLVLKAVQAAVGMWDKEDKSGNSSGINLGWSAGQLANGGVFGDGQRINKYAQGDVLTNGIYSKPTYFANGGTLNVLGEEPGRSEAVMPLMRMSNGDLGVQTTGGSGGTTNNVSVVVNVASDGTSNTSTTSSASDAKKMGEAIKAAVLGVIVEQQRPGGLLRA